MRTTLILDDKLLSQAKRRAAERNTTVSKIVNEALRESLTRQAEPPRPFQLITYGNPNKPEQHEPVDFKAILDEEDGKRLR